MFSIAIHHSNVLDKILTGCFLKSRHRIAGTAIKQTLQLVLDLATSLTMAMRADNKPKEGGIPTSSWDAAAFGAKLIKIHRSWESSMKHLVRLALICTIRDGL